jgi:histidine triad (HIT) family protein
MFTRSEIEDSCLFCKIVAGEEKSWTIYEDELVQAIITIEPMTLGHALIFPKEHYEAITEMPDTTLFRIIFVAKKLAEKYERDLGTRGLCLHSQDHREKRLEFRHYHLHLIPRYEIEDKRDPGKMWPKDLERASSEALDQLVSRILS